MGLVKDHGGHLVTTFLTVFVPVRFHLRLFALWQAHFPMKIYG